MNFADLLLGQLLTPTVHHILYGLIDDGIIAMGTKGKMRIFWRAKA